MLDEIGEVPLAMQPKLLHVLQEKEFERVGETRRGRSTCGSSPPRTATSRRRSRRDASAPTSSTGSTCSRSRTRRLRDRREDIPLLAEHFIETSARRLHREPPRLTETALRQLMSRDWPGNIRELENVIERAIILARDGHLRFEPGPSAATPHPESTSSPLPFLSRAAIERHQRDAILVALERSGGRVSGPRGAARVARDEVEHTFSPRCPFSDCDSDPT
jgi:transcriptional regulator with GAF, ATPase, and Fis domain